MDAKIDPLGNPDQGYGWYSKTIPYKDWHKINTAQRILANYLESLTTNLNHNDMSFRLIFH